MSEGGIGRFLQATGDETDRRIAAYHAAQAEALRQPLAEARRLLGEAKSVMRGGGENTKEYQIASAVELLAGAIEALAAPPQGAGSANGPQIFVLDEEAD